MNRFRPLTLAALALMTLFTARATAQRDQFVQQVSERVTDLLTLPEQSSRKDQEARQGKLLSLANYVSAHAGPRQTAAMVECEGAMGVFELVLTSRSDNAVDQLGLFASHPGFRRELGLLVKEKDNAHGVLALASTLMTQRSVQVEQYPALAAAMCVVHDAQSGDAFERRINENSPKSHDPLETFDFFVRNARTMSISPDQLPAIALVFVVDVTESAQQLQWAHDRYRGNPAIVDRFFEIQYDEQHFLQNKPKKVTSEPGDYNLQKIQRFGGVCADQAYFATSVAKACGIPSAYVWASGADVAHAWVGFVEKRGRRATWNFDGGRYEAYQQLRGNLLDPQTLGWINDGRVGVLASAMSVRNDQVLAALASAKVVGRMNGGHWSASEGMEIDTAGNIRKPRTGEVAQRLMLLRSTLGDCAGVPRAWDLVVEMAKAGELDEKQMDVWARAVMQLAGTQNQDFAYDFLVELIGTVQEPQKQHEMWEWAFGQFRTRPDLAAGVRFRQGELWSENQNPEYAWLAYNDVVEKFINEGPMVVSALKAISTLLESNRKSAEIVPILEAASRRVNRPGDMSTQFATQSNYYRIHMMLADAYQRVGRSGDAQRIKTQLGV